MSAIDKLIAAMQRTQLSYQRLARSTPVPTPDTDAQRAVANVLGDMIRLAAELREADSDKRVRCCDCGDIAAVIRGRDGKPSCLEHV